MPFWGFLGSFGFLRGGALSTIAYKFDSKPYPIKKPSNFLEGFSLTQHLLTNHKHYFLSILFLALSFGLGWVLILPHEQTLDLYSSFRLNMIV
jgi:hypothetical protein